LVEIIDDAIEWLSDALEWTRENWKLVLICVIAISAIAIYFYISPQGSFTNWVKANEKMMMVYEAVIGTIILIIAAVGYLYMKYVTGEAE
jgi:uncharacterized membrane protein